MDEHYIRRKNSKRIKRCRRTLVEKKLYSTLIEMIERLVVWAKNILEEV